ncbi:MAG: DUF4416 family protein [Deltaproteobacteria bacterium]|nr:DUF4416 family protein [Deltaproteobacteria bacterium]
MSVPRPPEPCLLVLGILRAPSVPLAEILAAVEERFGPVGPRSPERTFTHSAYYDGEMGGRPERSYACLAASCDPGELAGVKLATNELEGRWAEGGRRKVNLDPGTLNLVQLVLASGKPAAHRVYLGRGIYAEIEYTYERGSFRPLPWTYPDYGEPSTLAYFNELRESYRLARKEVS